MRIQLDMASLRLFPQAGMFIASQQPQIDLRSFEINKICLDHAASQNSRQLPGFRSAGPP